MKKTKKTLAFLLALIMIAAIMPQMTLPVSAGAADEAAAPYLTVKQNDSFNKDGKYYMSFTIDNYQEIVYIGGFRYGEKAGVDASVINSSDKQVQSWKRAYAMSGERNKWDFGIDFSPLPSGKYKFVMKITVIDDIDIYTFTWSYNLNYTKPTPSFSYKSYETYYDKDGRYMHKINIQTKNMKGHKLYIKVYDGDGYLVHSNNGIERKTNDEIGWFAWDGYTNGKKNPSGEYLFVITNSANNKVVEKTLNLKILEVAQG
jgi:hypothetical protein